VDTGPQTTPQTVFGKPEMRFSRIFSCLSLDGLHADWPILGKRRKKNSAKKGQTRAILCTEDFALKMQIVNNYSFLTGKFFKEGGST
jgi:hypothetical protein